MFLLSDGHDDNTGADIRVQEHIQHYNIDDKIVIHTFGYGSDHDAPVMNTIASFMGGAFYYIDDINKVTSVSYCIGIRLLCISNEWHVVHLCSEYQYTIDHQSIMLN